MANRAFAGIRFFLRKQLSAAGPGGIVIGGYARLRSWAETSRETYSFWRFVMSRMLHKTIGKTLNGEFITQRGAREAVGKKID